MRPALYATALVALAALFPPQQYASLLASTASVLVEALPFLALGAFAPWLGCGCGRAGARALPVAALTWLVFGPAVAIVRFAAAAFVAHLVEHHHTHDTGDVASELVALLPSAAIASIVMHLAGANALPHNPTFEVLAGALVGFVGAPCALGGIGIASALAPHEPLAAGAMLCVSGIVDARTVLARSAIEVKPNGALYAGAALLCTFVALRDGAQLVHPLLTVPLALGASVFFWKCTATRWRVGSPAWVALATAFAGLVIGAPTPSVRVTETTLADAYPGERVDFTGMLERNGTTASLVRYAITCCRADAQPVVIRLMSNPRGAERTWFHAAGTFSRDREGLALTTTSIERRSPPIDPFVYR